MAVAYKQPEPNRSVRPRTRRRRSRVRNVLMCIGASMLLSGPLCYVGLYAKITQNGYHRAQLTAELRKARTENEYLHAEMRMLSCPDRLAAAAVKAGMVTSDNVQIVRVPTSVKLAKADSGD